MPSDPQNWNQRVGVLCTLPGVLREFGVAPGRLLRRVGLPAHVLDDPGSVIPFRAIPELLESATRVTRCPHLGLLMAQRFRLEHLGVLGDLMTCARTLGESLSSYAVTQRLFSQGFAPSLVTHGGEAALRFTVFHPDARTLAVAADTLLGAGVAAIRELRGNAWRPLEVRLPRRTPHDPKPHRAYFRCKVRFDSDDAAVVFLASDLQLPNRGAAPARFRTIEAEVTRRFDGQLLPAVFRSLRDLLARGDVTAAALADQFRMHERTLNRRLRAEGMTFQTILDQVRFQAARTLLIDTRLPITQIAASLGYSTSAAFSNAFKRWSGVSPRAWRRDHDARSQSDAARRR